MTKWTPTLEYRIKERERKRERYHSDPEFRKKQIEYSSAYQKRMWSSSEEFRNTKSYQAKNPKKPPVVGRPKIYV